MTNKNLGRLRKLDLREAWASEAGEFTPWLARVENLQLLGDAIGIDLEIHTQEARVGVFRADILCKNSADETWVLIENQLERTDHSHLGQLLTYAAGLEAVTIAWVAERFTEEHRASLDWLNEHTDEKINFFGLEIELWCINDSPPAPKFNVVCKPNEWTRYVSDAAKKIGTGELSGRPQTQYQYWSDFLTVLRKDKKVREARTPQASHWMGFPAGRTGFRLWTEIYLADNLIGAGIIFYPPHAKHFFSCLKAQKEKLEVDLGFELEWDERPERQHSYAGVYHACDPNDRSDWPNQHAWLADKLDRFQRVLTDYLRGLPDPPDSFVAVETR